MNISKIFLVTCFLYVTSLAGPLQALSTDKPVPAFQLETLDGQKLDQTTLRGKVVILHFWATWCEACREEMPRLDAFYQAHRNEGLVVVAISLDEAGDEARVVTTSKQFHFATAQGTRAKLHDFGKFRMLPATLVVDRDGIVRHDGVHRAGVMSTQQLEKIVLPLLVHPVQ